MKRRIAALVVVMAAATGATFWVRTMRARAVDPTKLIVSGTVEATEARLGFQSPGRLTEILVHEGDRVTAGMVLARLDGSELDARRQQAMARQSAAASLLAELQRGSRSEEIGQAVAAVGAAEEKAADARRDLDRSRTLHDGGAISLEVYQKAAAASEIAEKQLQQSREMLKLVRSGPRRERIEAQRAQVREAEAAIASVDALLANMRIVAPMDAVVTRRHREPNETVGAGQPVVTLMDPGDRWVRVYVPETRLGAVRIGARAAIHSDTYPGRAYAGRVTWISQEAEFTPKNVQTAEERVKLVYAVKVAVDRDEKMELKPGLPVDVEIETAG